LTAGAKHWSEAGEILVQLRNEDEHAFERIVAAHNFITHDMLEIFYHIGTKALHPMAPLLPRHVLAEVRKAGMTYEVQEEVMAGNVTVVTRVDHGVPVTKSKPISKLTAKEARYVLTRKGNASVAKQVSRLNGLAKPEPPKPASYKPTPPAVRLPKVIGQWAVRRTPAGYTFEKTMASHSGVQRVILSEGAALIQLVEYK
jgi:hypothetical protein